MNLETPYTPKSLHEAFCYAQAFLPTTAQGMHYRSVLQNLIDELNRMRPTGPDGKHGNLHTDLCGCKDK